MTTLYLIRHAQAEGNVYRFCQGQLDGKLTKNAPYQLGALAKRFADVHLDAVYASPLQRAAQTAEAVAAPKGLPVQMEQGLIEFHFGKLEGLPWGEVKISYPDLEDRFSRKDASYTLPGGESVRETASRMRDAVLKIAKENPGKTVAAASHGGALAALFALIDHEDMRDFSMYTYFGNTAVSKLEIDDDNTIRVIYRNDTDHLQTLPDKYVRAERPKPWHPDAKPIGSFGFDLWYRPADMERDLPLIRTYGEDAWHVIYGCRKRFDAGKFVASVKGQHDADGESVLLVMHGEKTVGLLMLDTRQKDEDGVGHISMVYLTEPYRRMGLGIQLIGKAEYFYGARGVHTLRLRVAKTNRAAIALYHKTGFVEARSIKGSLSGLLVMKKPFGDTKEISLNTEM